jgi:murein DD-endopeptidase MepM/ murein hydrolase activator NlpD
LLVRPRLSVGQPVSAGQVVAYSGDPDLTCSSRPHLHLEIRNTPSRTIAYNPMALIEADWEQLALFGSQAVSFERNLMSPNQWQSLLDQPQITFGHPLLNDYDQAWPPDG